MMPQRLFSVRLPEAKRDDRVSRFLLFLLPLIFCCSHVFCQDAAKFRADTLSLSRFEYAKISTNNGSDCICSIINSSRANLATVVVIGAPDSVTAELDNPVIFNGTHSLAPDHQIIAVGDFMGKQVVIMNLSLIDLPVTVVLFCPSD